MSMVRRTSGRLRLAWMSSSARPSTVIARGSAKASSRDRACTRSSSGDEAWETRTSRAEPVHARVQSSLAQHRQNPKSGSPGGQHLGEGPFEQPLPGEPVVVVDEARQPVAAGQVGLAQADVGVAQVVVVTAGRHVGLVVAAEPGPGLAHLVPLGEPLAPPLVVLRGGVELGEVEGQRADGHAAPPPPPPATTSGAAGAASTTRIAGAVSVRPDDPRTRPPTAPRAAPGWRSGRRARPARRTTPTPPPPPGPGARSGRSGGRCSAGGRSRSG